MDIKLGLSRAQSGQVGLRQSGYKNLLSALHLLHGARVLLEKLTGSQLVKKSPAFYPMVQYHIHKCPPPVPILSLSALHMTLLSAFLTVIT
jgi:hypothetical protein